MNKIDIVNKISEIKSITDFMRSKQYFNSDYIAPCKLLDERAAFLSSIKPTCLNCINRCGKSVTISNENHISEPMGACNINGMFPDGFILNNYSCDMWLHDDIPF
ncbi:hypothetical protein [Dickeya phage Sucellus]|nr:hypothetical protein [Dickeya phage Sucellus]